MKNILEFETPDAHMRCKQGEIVGLLGRNGCGKTTLLKGIFGIGVTEYKSIRVNGNWIANGYSESTVTMLPQANMIPSHMSIRTAMRLFDVDVSRMKDVASDKLSLLDQRSVQLSGGERRFFELLLILFSGSKFSFLDEPFSGLSRVMIERSIEIMKEVKKEKGLLVTDHMYRYVTACSDRLYCMHDRRTVEIHGEDELIRYGYINHG